MQIRHPQTVIDMWTAHRARQAKSDEEIKFSQQFDVQLTVAERRIAELEDTERELLTLRDTAQKLRKDRDAAFNNGADFAALADDLRDLLTRAVADATAQPGELRDQVLAACAQHGIPVPPTEQPVAVGNHNTQQIPVPEGTHS